ncbi:hypothetical protein Droror1_Dr00006381 [Drosera rotundifolia]
MREFVEFMDSCYCIWPPLMTFVLLAFGILCGIGVADGTHPPPPWSNSQRPPASRWSLSPAHEPPGSRVAPPPHSRLPTPNLPSSNGSRVSPPRHALPPPQVAQNNAGRATPTVSHLKGKGLNLGKKVGLAFGGIVVILQFIVVGFLVFERRQLLKMRD